jgi:hypothetical protein
MNMSAEEREAFIKKEKDFRALFYDRFSHLRRFHEETDDDKREGSSSGEGGNE